MSNEYLENLEKLEQIEASALENCNEVTPLEADVIPSDVSLEQTPEINHSVEMSGCRCTGGCGGSYSMTNDCTCTGGCGSPSYHK